MIPSSVISGRPDVGSSSRRVRLHESEAAAMAEEIVDLEMLVLTTSTSLSRHAR